MDLKIVKKEDWKFPPTLNRHGSSKYPFDLKTLLYLESNDFPHQVIMTSDLHSHSIELFRRLEKVLDLSQFHLITGGDMSGALVKGTKGDRDTTPFYQEILSKVKSLYLIQGNHDLPPPKPLELRNLLINSDGSGAYLEDGKVQQTEYGKIGGVHGIISNKEHPYKKPEEQYYSELRRFQRQKNKPDILITHDTPRFFWNNQEFIGKDEIYQEVLKINPKMYLYGHCHHHRFHTFHNNTDFFNLDGRVLIWNVPKK